MLVDINLLQKKDKKNLQIILPISILFCIMAIGCILFSIKYYELQHEYTNTKQNLLSEKKLYLEVKKSMNTSTPTGETELKNAVNWLENYPFSTVFMLKQLTELLPERGFIMRFDYQDNGIVQLLVQFDTNQEVAYYLKNLNDSKYIKKVSLIEISTVDYQASNSLVDDKGDFIIPRYNANFSIQLNKEQLKLAKKEEDR